MSVRRASQKDKDGMQRSDSHKEAEMRRASLTQMVRTCIIILKFTALFL